MEALHGADGLLRGRRRARALRISYTKRDFDTKTVAALERNKASNNLGLKHDWE
jgi:hypothetical protein